MFDNLLSLVSIQLAHLKMMPNYRPISIIA